MELMISATIANIRFFSSFSFLLGRDYLTPFDFEANKTIKLVPFPRQISTGELIFAISVGKRVP